MSPTLSYCGQEVRKHDYDRFLLSLFIPAESRETFLALNALNCELMNVRGMVSEEMIGHIRYAWWHESLEKLASGTQPQGHPVLEALYQEVAAGRLDLQGLLLLSEHYREHYPGAPPVVETLLDNQSLALISARCPQAEKNWLKARDIIVRHRMRHSGRRTLWLNLKLLWAGLV